MSKFASVLACVATIVWGPGALLSQGEQCYSFSTGGYACPGCAPTNNCGNCSGGLCNATLAQECQVKVTAVPKETGGWTKTTIPVPCSYKLDCVVPSPCSGASCTLGNQPHGFSEEIAYNDKADQPCPIDIGPPH